MAGTLEKQKPVPSSHPSARGPERRLWWHWRCDDDNVVDVDVVDVVDGDVDGSGGDDDDDDDDGGGGDDDDDDDDGGGGDDDDDDDYHSWSSFVMIL